MNATFQRFVQRFPLLAHVGGAAVMGGVAEAIDEKWVKHHISTMTDQIEVELLDEEQRLQSTSGAQDEATGGSQSHTRGSSSSSKQQQKNKSSKNEEDASFWDSYFGDMSERSTYWGRILESSITSGLMIGPLARFWYPFLHRLTLSRGLINRPVNLKVAFMTAMDMLPFMGSTIVNLLFVSRGFEYLEKMGVIRFPDSVKEKIAKGLEESSQNDEYNVIEIELSEIINLQKLRDEPKIQELAMELNVSMEMSMPQLSWLIVPVLAAVNFKFVPVVYRGLFAMASTILYRVPAHMVLEDDSPLNRLVFHTLELRDAESDGE